jgi:hypothetical protein
MNYTCAHKLFKQAKVITTTITSELWTKNLPHKELVYIEGM